MIRKLISCDGKPRAAILLSGSGSNADKLLQSLSEGKSSSWEAAVLVTDNPKNSKTEFLANKYGLPHVSLDIREFYKERGETRVSLRTERGREIREEWTAELRRQLEPMNIDFGILAGFVPLTNLTNDFPCLNVHPGDLTVEKNGQRILVGLHTIPVEIAMLEELTSLRSSVIVAQTYTGQGGEMDSGPILGLSEAVDMDFKGLSFDDIEKLNSERPDKRPVGGYKDELEDVADHNQTLLKENGDWIVFPPAVDDFAAGNFGLDENHQLHYMVDGEWKAVQTVVYNETEAKPRFI